MKQEFEMTEEQFQRILNAGRPVMYIIANGTEPVSPQESANRAWQNLADELGFVWNSVEPSSKGERFFTAEKLESEGN